MPYNTRRKSLSLPSLGIHVPNTSRAHRSPSASKPVDIQPPPSKKAKRSHERDAQSPDTVSSAAQTRAGDHDAFENLARKSRRGTGTYEHTPPPSPADMSVSIKVDTEGISDEVVVAVIDQLQKTGNRPHLIKELAAVLSTTNAAVASSANPPKLLSSRLGQYMKRSWTALAPCPLAKELIPIHPGKTFYYLTTCPHQPLPANSDDIITAGMKAITPSASNASTDQDDEDALTRERSRLSPSPEVDLSSPEFDDTDGQDAMDDHAGPGEIPTPAGSFSSRSSMAPLDRQRGQLRLTHNHRAASPPLEGDEKEFTQTASSVRERASSSEENAARQRLSEQDTADTRDSTPSGLPLSGLTESLLSASEESQSTDQSHGYRQSIEYDYFSHNHDHDFDAAAVAALFGTSPSPSLLSDSSSVSSSGASSVMSSADAQAIEQENNLLANPIVSASDAAKALLASVAGSKRSISMLEAEYATDRLHATMDDSKQMSNSQLSVVMDIDNAPVMQSNASEFAFEMEMGTESWSDLRSPETIEVDELDEIFAEI